MSRKKKNKTQPPESRVEAELREAAVPYRCAEPGAAQANEFAEDKGWIDFRDQCRRQMQRPMALRLKYGFCRMYKPVLDDAPWRAFKTMAEYRTWCEKNLPDYLGFKRPVK